jgi:hypothetical protein
MTSRFEQRLSVIDQMLLVTLIASTATLMFPSSTAAQTTNQNNLVFEIKNVKIPNTENLSDLLNGTNKEGKIAPTAINPPPSPTPTIQSKVVTASIVKQIYDMPPKVTGTARVYMHEPAIRAYVCPKLGDRCNTFMAILAAENGTHECTRDNRGLNRNGSVDIGLAQINWTPGSPYGFEQLQDCKFNLDVALQKVASRGFQPWAAYTKGVYLNHLPAMLASANALAATQTQTNVTLTQ